jgi:hypothetical protein
MRPTANLLRGDVMPTQQKRQRKSAHKVQKHAKSCFVLMPFSNDFKEVYEVIERVVEAHGFNCSRADKIAMSGSVVMQILKDIHKADMIISDLTYKNPNVFYETGHAHATKDPEKLIIITQRAEDVPFDLQALRYIQYDNHDEGKEILANRLGEFVRQGKASSGGLFETIEGGSERTRRIVADLEALLKNPRSFLESLTIRVQAGLSSIAICENEPRPARPRGQDAAGLLVKERDLLRRLIKEGASAKVILCPPIGRWVTENESFAYLKLRYERMIALLENKLSDQADNAFRSERCEILLAPFRGNNLLILGDSLFYEGVKVDIAGGFSLTTRVTHAGSVAARVHAFDKLFEDAKKYTLRYHAQDPHAPETHQNLQLATLQGVKEGYAQFVRVSAAGAL